MKYSQAILGRVFVIRLEDGEVVHEEIERFVKDQGITAAALIIIGGAAEGSKLVVGPEQAQDRPIIPMVHVLDDVHEIAGTGTLFPDEDGNPVLHMHMACGREASSITGCIRQGVKVWQVMEVILFELTGNTAIRALDSQLGFNLLQMG
ncbi:MAG: DNA-binding protein [Deltaproteobacteria bacterium]|nr:DNA-binding protein [Deltaproteobacteria bacterium]